MSLLDDIKAAHGPEHPTVEIAAWGVSVPIQRMTAQTLLRLEDLRATGIGEAEYLAEVLIVSLLNEAGGRLLEPQDEYLVRDNPTLLTEAGVQVLRLNGLLRDAKKKNGALPDSSPTGSALPWESSTPAT